MRYDSIADLVDHAFAAARELNVKIQECPNHGFNGFASLSKRFVHTMPISSEESYAAVMHELGHIACEHEGHRHLIHPDTVVKNEHDAWQWAEAHALAWTPAMVRTRAECLATYDKMMELAQLRKQIAEWLEKLIKDEAAKEAKS